MSSRLPVVLDQLLLGVERRRRRLALGRGLALAVVVFVLGVVAVAAIDALALPGIPLRRGLSWGLYLVVAAVALGAGVVPWLRRRGALRAARAVERTGVVADERLSAAVELAATDDRGVSRWMVDRTVALATAAAEGIDPRAVVDGCVARRLLLAAGVAGLLLAVSLVEPVTRHLVLRAVVPGADLERPAATALAIQPGGTVRLAQGSDLRIVARVDPLPERVQLAIEWDDGLSEDLSMVPEGGGRYVRTLRGMSQACRFRVRAGDAESTATRVLLDEPPRVEALELLVQPPAYTGLGPRQALGGDTEAPVGSRIELTAEVRGAAVRSAVLIEADGTERAMRIEHGRVRCEWQLDAATTYGLRLVSSDGLVVEPARRWRIEASSDEPPTVALERVGGTSVAAHEPVMLRVSAGDDLGLRSIHLAWRSPTGDEGRQGVPVDDLTDVRLERLVAIDLERFELAVGDRITFHAEVRDRGGQLGRSEELVLQVVDPAAATGAAISEELRRRLDELGDLRERWRTWESGWTGLRLAYRSEDHALHRGTILVHGSVLQEVSQRTEVLAAELEDLSTTGLVADHGHRIALALRGWDEDRRATLAAQVEGIGGARPPAEAERVVGAVERIAVRAGGQLDRIERWLRLLAAAHDAMVLDGRSEAALARLERSLDVLAARRAWLDPRMGPGLRRALFRGHQPVGEPVDIGTGLPLIENQPMPVVGREDYALRWVGELLVPDGEDWRFAGEVDDGLRVEIDGHPVIGDEAWKQQAPTVYRGDIAAAPGWRPITIEYFQGPGGARLRCWLERGEERRELDASILRHRIEADLLAAMVRLSPQHVHTATAAAGEDLALLTVAPRQAEALAREGGAEAIPERARAVREAFATQEGVYRSDLAVLGVVELEAIAGGARPVVELTAATARELRELLDRWARDWTPASESLGRMAQRAERIQRAIGALHQERDGLEAIELEQRSDVLRMDADVLGTQLRRAQREAHEGARSAASGVAERLRQVDLEVGLAQLVHRPFPRLEDALGTLGEDEGSYHAAGESAGELARELRRLATVEAELATARIAATARAALAADDRVQAASEAAVAALAAEQREGLLAEIADQLRRLGRGELAGRLAAAAGTAAPLERRERAALRELADADAAALAAADTRFDDDLEQMASIWEGEVDRADEIALAALPLRMDAGGEQLRQRGNPASATALDALAAELRALAADVDGVSPEALRALAARGQAAAQQAEPEDGGAAGETLAHRLTADDAAAASAARAELERLAAADGSQRMARADAAFDLAQRLEQLAANLAEAEAEERAAVAIFAQLERELAARMDDLRPELDAVGTKDLRAAMAAVAAALPEHARRADALGQAAERVIATQPSPVPTVAAGGAAAETAGLDAERASAAPPDLAAALSAAGTAVARAEAAVERDDPRGLAAGLQRSAAAALATAQAAADDAEELAASMAGDERPAAAATTAAARAAARERAIQQAEAARSLARNAETLASGGRASAGSDPMVADALSREAQREADRWAESARVQGADSPAAHAAAQALERALAAHRALAQGLIQAPRSERPLLRANLQRRLTAARAVAAVVDPDRAGAIETLRATVGEAQTAGGVDGERQRLASEALRAADAIEDELLAPVAAAQDAALGAGREEPAGADFGQELAALAEGHRGAAGRLARAMAWHDRTRAELAAALARAEALRTGGSAAGFADPEQASSQATADRQQAGALEAWAAAAAGGSGSAASEAQQAATAAQAAALGSDPGMRPAAQRHRAIDNLGAALGAMRGLGPSQAEHAAVAAAARDELARAAASQAAAAGGAAEDLRAQADDLLAAGGGEADATTTAAARAAADAMAATGDAAAAVEALSQAAAAQRLAAAASGAPGAPAGASGQPGESAGETPGPSSESGGTSAAASDSDGEGSGGLTTVSDPSLEHLEAVLGGEDHAAWARLPERVRQTVRRGDWERFGEEYQAAIRAYFTALAEGD